MLDKPAHAAAASPSQANPNDPGGGLSRDTLPGFIAAIRQRRWTLLLTVVLLPLCAWLTLRQIVPLYTATGALIYEPSSYRMRELQSLLVADPTTDATMASQAEILQSLHIAEQVARRGDLFGNPEFNAALRPPGLLSRAAMTVREMLGLDAGVPDDPVYGPVADPARNAVIAAARDALHAAAVRSSHVVEVTFTAADAMVAAAAVNNAMDTYIKEQYAAKHRLVDDAIRLLNTERDELREQVRRTEERISTYRRQHALSQGMHAGTDTEEITHLTEDLVKARSERAATAGRLDAARGRAGAEAEAAVAPSVVQLRAQVGQLAGQVQSLSGRLGSAHPDVKSLGHIYDEAKRSLAAETEHVVAAAETELRSATQRVSALETLLRDAKAAADDDAKAQIPLNAMTRDLDAAREQLQAVLGRIEQTKQQAAVESSEAHEISLAMPPERPSYPRAAPTLAATFAASIFVGLILVYLLQLADTTLHNGAEIRTLTGLPCLALVPEVGKRALGHLKIHDYIVRRPLTAFAEQIRSLRAGVSLDIDHPQVVAITAARPAEGKSLLTLTLGRSAQLGGERVLAIECDVRQASFQHRLDGQAAPGLLDVLRGEIEWRDAVQSDPLTGMGFLTAGKPGGDVLGLFLSDEMRQLLAEARDTYDLILLDAPPVEAMTEARVAAALADATLLCVRWRSTQTPTLMHTLEVLRGAHARIIGAVLTRVDPRAHLRSGYADSGVYHRRYRAYFRG